MAVMVELDTGHMAPKREAWARTTHSEGNMSERLQALLSHVRAQHSDPWEAKRAELIVLFTQGRERLDEDDIGVMERAVEYIDWLHDRILELEEAVPAPGLDFQPAGDDPRLSPLGRG